MKVEGKRTNQVRLRFVNWKNLSNCLLHIDKRLIPWHKRHMFGNSDIVWPEGFHSSHRQGSPIASRLRSSGILLDSIAKHHSHRHLYIGHSQAFDFTPSSCVFRKGLSLTTSKWPESALLSFRKYFVHLIFLLTYI